MFAYDLAGYIFFCTGAALLFYAWCRGVTVVDCRVTGESVEDYLKSVRETTIQELARMETDPNRLP